MITGATNLAEALAEAGIRPKSLRTTTPQQMVCPKCHGGRSRDACLTLTIDTDTQGAVWCCHRASCGWTDGCAVGPRRVLPFARQARPVVMPAPVPPEDMDRPALLYEFFEERKISRATVDHFGLYLARHWFRGRAGAPDGIQGCVVFPYVHEGKVVNRKYRTRDKRSAQEKDPLHTLYNVEAIQTPDQVVWVEGEIDCLAVHEAGWPQVVSLKDGAPDKLRAEDDPARGFDRRYEALNTHADLLETVACFILAGDADEPGLVLREELARRLGRHRCKIARWPDDCKDANDVLLKHSSEVLTQCLLDAKPYPVDDVQEITGPQLDAYLDLPPPPVLTTGTTATDRILTLPGEGRLIIITGIPSAGKSQWTMFEMIHLMLRENRRFLVFSPEMQPWEEFAVQCAQVLVGKMARRGRHWMEGDPLMPREERLWAGDWLSDRLRFLASDSVDRPPTLDWFLDRSHEAVLRFGVTDTLIDPWNEMEHERGAMSETDYISRALQRAKGFANRHGCNVWIIAHPTKMRATAPGEEIPPPGLYDINGSAAWANKADIGITIHTTGNSTSVMLTKARFARWGRKGTSADLNFDVRTGRYSSPTSVQADHGADPWPAYPGMRA